MPARLFCEVGELAGSAYTIDHEAVIGRERENEIVLHPGFVSGRHARIFFDEREDRYFVEDLGSSNGTLLDGVPVTEPMRLDRLHVITFANALDFIFQRLTPTQHARAEAARYEAEANEKTVLGDAFGSLVALPDEEATPTAEAAPPAEPQDDTAETTRLAGNFAPQPPLPEEESTLPEEEAALPEEDDTTKLGAYFDALRTGSFDEAPAEPEAHAEEPEAHAEEPSPEPLDDELGQAETIVFLTPTTPKASFVLEVTLHGGETMTLPLKEGANVLGREESCDLTLPDPSISRNHALLTVRGTHIWLKDLGSKNGTFVGGEQCTTEIEISPETLIRFGLGLYASLRQQA